MHTPAVDLRDRQVELGEQRRERRPDVSL